MISCMIIILLCLFYAKIPTKEEETRVKTIIIIINSIAMFSLIGGIINYSSPVYSSAYKEVDLNVESKYILDIEYENISNENIPPTIKSIYDIDGNEVSLKNIDNLGITSRLVETNSYNKTKAIGEVKRTTYKYALNDNVLRAFYFMPKYKYYTVMDVSLFFNA